MCRLCNAFQSALLLHAGKGDVFWSSCAFLAYFPSFKRKKNAFMKSPTCMYVCVFVLQLSCFDHVGWFHKIFYQSHGAGAESHTRTFSCLEVSSGNFRDVQTCERGVTLPARNFSRSSLVISATPTNTTMTVTTTTTTAAAHTDIRWKCKSLKSTTTHV